ncbi:MAG: SDR family NAD(P)-dependent oxidoreductase [Chloroflexi bacterium]|nr:SDR family NAD(P)-dependent oxidoreductase [Chloroflexota bacterium]
MAGRLAGKVAIITGASRGLGEYCAIEYGREGATVVIAARTEQVSNPILEGTIYSAAIKVDEVGGEGFPVVCNVADRASVEQMVETVLAKYGRIDILMNNAGVLVPGALSDLQSRHWELQFRVNVNGPFFCTRAVLPTMVEQRSGSIINISSVAADREDSGSYGITKRAVEDFTRQLAREVRAHGIAVNALKPVAAIETPGMRFGHGGDLAPDVRAGLPTAASYVEAAVLLALQTPDTCTGEAFNDEQAVERLADAATKARLRS